MMNLCCRWVLWWILGRKLVGWCCRWICVAGGFDGGFWVANWWTGGFVLRVGLPVGLIVDFGSQIGGLVGLCCGCWVYVM